MNVIIPPSHNQQSQSEQYQEVVNQLGCGFSEKYTLVNGKKHGLYEYRNGIYIYLTVPYVHGNCHGTKIKYFGMTQGFNNISEKTEFVNNKQHGYTISYRISGMPKSISYYDHGKYCGIFIKFNKDASINYDKSDIPTNTNITEFINAAFSDININNCLDRQRQYDLMDDSYYIGY